MLPEPASNVIATVLGGAVQLINDPDAQGCAKRGCLDQDGGTKLVAYGEARQRIWNYCPTHGAEALVWVEAKMPGNLR